VVELSGRVARLDAENARLRGRLVEVLGRRPDRTGTARLRG
jgi:hypothetical protein